MEVTTSLDDGGMVEGVADGHINRIMREGESAGGDEEIAHIDEIGLVNGHFPLETQLLVVTREYSIVCENCNYTDVSTLILGVICFHTDNTVDYR